MPPAPFTYVGSAGFVQKSLATNIKGSPGANGTDAFSRPMFYAITGTKRTTPPTTSWSNLQGDFIYVNSSLDITNTFTSSRWFVVEGEVPVSNDSGNDSWAVLLMMRTDSSWAASQPQIKAQQRLDVNYSRTDFVNAAPFPAVHKIRVRATVLILAGQTQYFRMALTQTDGGSSKYSSGMIEVYGL
jgi:hypothetical protein